MTRTFLGAVAVAATLAPSLASARPAAMPARDTTLSMPNRFDPGQPIPPRLQVQPFAGGDNAALGNATNGRSNGDVAGPGKHARIDTSTKGPMDDRDPGNPNSEDVPRSANPRPLR